MPSALLTDFCCKSIVNLAGQIVSYFQLMWGRTVQCLMACMSSAKFQLEDLLVSIFL